MSDRIKWKKIKEEKKSGHNYVHTEKSITVQERANIVSLSNNIWCTIDIYILYVFIYAASHNSEPTFSLFSTEKCVSLQEYFLRIPTVYLQFFFQNSKQSRKVKTAFKSTKRATCTCTTVRTVIYHNLSLSPYHS